ncbi:MAG: transglycosylase domain-containing protein, partial [Flavobacteriales bacterium]|nr:transglycosylase domain-containing protein [Flavobacteriales bacterium]
MNVKALKKVVMRVVHVRSWPRRVKWLAIATAGFIVLGALVFMLFIAALLNGRFGPLPDAEELADIRNYVGSEVYSRDSVLLGTYFVENRTNVKRSEIPDVVINALVSTEDARFFEHHGVDKRSMLRVLFKSLLGGDQRSGGGSTISQQLAKNLYPRKSFGKLSMPVNKAREAIIAMRLEDTYSKDEILVLYLNTVPFGEDVYGIEAAARRFFNKKPMELQVEEAAVLIGLLKAPTQYNPRVNPKNSLFRRNVVLGQMNKYGYLDRESADSITSLPLTLNYGFASHSDGPAPYFREYLRLWMLEWCKEHKKPNGENYNLYTDGLKIYTTIHSDIQRYAEKAVAKHMRSLQNTFYKHWGKTPPWRGKPHVMEMAMKRSQRYQRLKKQDKSKTEIKASFNDTVHSDFFSWDGDTLLAMTAWDSLAYYQKILQAGFIASDVNNGELLAWVGGIRHRYFKYDHVTAKRQAGSTFKPLVYAAALEKGFAPCDYVSNRQKTYKEYEDWQPENAEEEYGGKYSLYGGLAHSVNTVSVQLLMETGIPAVISLARKMGVSSELKEVPSLALGISDVSLLEMVQAYSVFANGGLYRPSSFLLAVTKEDGTLIQDFTKERKKAKRVVSTATANTMNFMLQKVVEEGTAHRLRTTYGLRGDMAGKTGTTQSHADGWYIGLMPGIAAGAWVGA